MWLVVSSLSHIWLFVTPWTVAHQVPLSMGFPRQEYWRGLPVPSPGDLSDSGIKPLTPALAGRFCITLSHPGSPWIWLRSVQFSRSVMSNSLWPHGLRHTSLPVHHQLPKITQTHVHWVGDAIQPSHPLSSPSPPTFNLSQHQGFFKWVSYLHQVAKVLEFQL